MSWYLAGAILSAVILWYKRKWRIEQKERHQALLILTIGLLMAGFLHIADKGEAAGETIKRGEPGSGTVEKEFYINAGRILQDYTLEINIQEQKLTSDQRQKYFAKAKKELDRLVPGENPSKEEITKPLYLPEALLKGAVTASYSFSDYKVFYPDGSLRKETEKPVLVQITAEMICQGETCLYTFYVRAVPVKKTREQQFTQELKKTLKAENEKEDSQTLKLPAKVNGTAVTWVEKKENRSLPILFLSIAGAVGIVARKKEQAKQEKTKIEKQMLLDYPEIIGKLVLLMNAGMNTTMAWEKIVLAYHKKCKNKEIPLRYAYEEMTITLHEIRDGIGELQAYKNFGERCGYKAYRKLSAILTQSLRKGNKDMLNLLEDEECQAFEERKTRARKAGEEAGTKLLFPMMLMLVVVIVILIVPAGLTMKL